MEHKLKYNLIKLKDKNKINRHTGIKKKLHIFSLDPMLDHDQDSDQSNSIQLICYDKNLVGLSPCLQKVKKAL